MATELDQFDKLSHDDEQGASEDLAIIREQTSETLQILRNLLSLMMPKEDDGGPKLVDLIAALVAQQRDILVGIKRLQSDMNALFGRLDGKIGAETQSNSVG
jgi:DNA-directed RNA polymerase sigma subunit (sigma70/sigma32)